MFGEIRPEKQTYSQAISHDDRYKKSCKIKLNQIKSFKSNETTEEAKRATRKNRTLIDFFYQINIAENHN